MDLSIRLSDPHRTRLSGEVAVSWEDSSAGRTWKIRVGLRRHEAPYADISGQAATEYQVSQALLGEDLTRLTQKNTPGLADNPQVGNIISHAAADDTQFSHGTPPSSQISEDESITVVDFWNSLSPEEKQAFRSLAAKRVFATGARLMHEGEQANHVAVILDGWTEIRVREGGGERVVARRGPGQLVGERAALQISVRSATVVAIQPVDALVMHTEDFVAFVSDHPGVLSIVENQIFTRLREGPPAQDPQPDGTLGIPEDVQAAAPSRSGGRSRIEPAVTHAQPPNGENCTVLLTDVVAFGADRRNEEDRRIIRRRVFKMTRSALEPMWDSCLYEDRGDGLLIVVPSSIPTAQALERLLTVLPTELKRHNRIYGGPIQVQLRVAATVGPVTRDIAGMSGKAIILAARMLDAALLRQAMTEDDAILGVVVSPFVYDTAVSDGGNSLEPAAYTQVPVQVKEPYTTAWMRLIGQADRP
jgi:Cyclic nucleotide-binding domain